MHRIPKAVAVVHFVIVLFREDPPATLHPVGKEIGQGNYGEIGSSLQKLGSSTGTPVSATDECSPQWFSIWSDLNKREHTQLFGGMLLARFSILSLRAGCDQCGGADSQWERCAQDG